MTTAIKRRRGTTAQHATFTGLEGELTIDTTKDTVVVHDGATAGGFPLAKESQATTNVAITGGTITGITDLAIADGGTGASTASDARTNLGVTATGADTTYAYRANNLSDLASASTARTNLGLGTIATQAASSVAVTGGTIDNTVIGGTTPAAVSSTNLSYTGTLTGGTGVVNLGSGQFYKDASGNVFVGATSAGFAEKFRVYGNYSVFDNGTYTGFIGAGGSLGTGVTTDFAFRSSNAMAFLTGGATERMRIDSSGNVGIGTSSPTMYWSSSNKGLSILGTTNGAEIDLKITGGISTSYLLQTLASDFNIGNSGAYPIKFYTSDTERMRIDSSGNVLIGATATSGNSNLRVSSSSTRTFALIDTTATTGAEAGLRLKASRDWYTISDYDSGALKWFDATAVAERMRIDSSGNLLVGKTTTALNTMGSVIGYGSSFFTSNIAGAAIYCNKIGANGDQIYFYNATSLVGYIGSTSTTTSYNTSSDYRLKENIAPMTGALDVVQALKPVTYNWKADGSSGQGFIAHELAEVVPDCVTGEKDAVDEEGKPVYQGIDTSFLVATLTAAIQEQQVMIEELKAKVAALEAA